MKTVTDFLRGAAKAVWAAIGAGVTAYIDQVIDLSVAGIEVWAPAAVAALLAYLIPNRGPQAPQN